MAKRNKIVRQWRELHEDDRESIINSMIYELERVKNDDCAALIDFLSLSKLQKKIDKVKNRKPWSIDDYDDDELPF